MAHQKPRQLGRARDRDLPLVIVNGSLEDYADRFDTQVVNERDEIGRLQRVYVQYGPEAKVDLLVLQRRPEYDRPEFLVLVPPEYDRRMAIGAIKKQLQLKDVEVQWTLPGAA